MKTTCLLIALTCFYLTTQAQENASNTPKSDSSQVIAPPKPRSSPMATSFFKKEDLYVKVVYGQPNKKGRQVFGTLVPYGEVWRTGANEATEFTTTKDIRLAGKSLRAGTYTIFTVPDREKWTVIVNAELGQWGEYKYKDFKSKDVLTFETPAQRVTGEIHEAFTIKFLENTNGADMVMQWDDTKVAVPISVGAVSTGKTSKKKGK